MINGFLGAAQFLTRVPIRLQSEPEMTATVPWFPVVGGLIGAAIGGVAAGMMELVPASVAAAVAIIFGLALTGAFHEDGLADTADALGGWTPQQRREILKDSRHGSYGVAALCASIVLRIICVATLGPATAFAGLVAAHTLGRGAAVGVMGSFRGLPDAGLGAEYSRSLSRSAAVIGVAGSIAIAVLAAGWWAAPLSAIAMVGALIVALIARRAFGGISGDILGAVEQFGECLVLIVVTGLAIRHQLWWV